VSGNLSIPGGRTGLAVVQCGMAVQEWRAIAAGGTARALRPSAVHRNPSVSACKRLDFKTHLFYY